MSDYHVSGFDAYRKKFLRCKKGRRQSASVARDNWEALSPQEKFSYMQEAQRQIIKLTVKLDPDCDKDKLFSAPCFKETLEYSSIQAGDGIFDKEWRDESIETATSELTQQEEGEDSVQQEGEREDPLYCIVIANLARKYKEKRRRAEYEETKAEILDKHV